MSVIFDGNDVTSILRGSAKKQLDSYADEWIVWLEALQNALDAVNGIDDGRVHVEIDPRHNQVTVFDNGAGFPKDEVFFTLGKGTKADAGSPNVRGEHGVGMKMIALCSERLDLWTKNDDGTAWHIWFADGHQFVDAKETYGVEASVATHPLGEYTTAIRYKFPPPGAGIRDLNVSELLIEILRRYDGVEPVAALARKPRLDILVQHHFRTSSYTGDVNRLFDEVVPAKVSLEIAPDTATAQEEWPNVYGTELADYWKRPHHIEFPAKYWDPTEWYSDPAQAGILGNEQLGIFNPGLVRSNRMWVLRLTNEEEIDVLLTNPDMRDAYPAGYFDQLKQEKIRGLFLVVAPGSESKFQMRKVMLGEPGQIIAADGVVTTNEIKTPKRGKNQNYLNNIHVVLNIADRVNYGKQGVKNPTLLKRLYQFFEEAYVKKLVALAQHVAGKGGGSGPTPPEQNIVDADVITTPGVQFKRIPQTENSLIALTSDLIGCGLITGIDLFHLSSIHQYDGRGLLNYTGHSRPAPSRDDDLDVFEFKLNLPNLVSDCEDGTKALADIDLVIVWDDELKVGSGKYTKLALEDSSRYATLSVTGVDKVLVDNTTGAECPILSVKSLVGTAKSPSAIANEARAAAEAAISEGALAEGAQEEATGSPEGAPDSRADPSTTTEASSGDAEKTN